ncbi:glycoside hydrolase family 16 protein [Metamycoplasma phocicerebrale]|uniref:Glycoside hydrolase family 16 protein n=1 Tax=Metamycoplasma phocicerebrale TaxID=142649 RepID=A0A3Q9VBD5_9BACT|nr:glycoside hydrolase family 16 protein [Metamycoplasma phocicerebrale]AZZ65317.1 glycoside hydrolase family 16 protein [Metamycoplasma phocicerebrale]
MKRKMKKLLLGLSSFLTALPIACISTLVSCQKKENNFIEPLANAKVPYLDNNWVCTWADEFDNNKLDENKWTQQIRKNNHNNEKQYYTDKNIIIKDSILSLIAKKEEYHGKHYTSAKLITKDKKSFKYGRLQIKAKNPKGRGTWPAIWMLPVNKKNIEWPHYGEIDIMEYVGFDESKIFQTIHTGQHNHKNKTQIGSSYLINSSDRFLVYEFIWYPDRLEWYVDNTKIFETKYLKNKERDVERAYEEVFPFDKEFYLILNLAIGGTWAGKKGIDENIFPISFDVDYVRYYEFDYKKVDKIIPEKINKIFKSKNSKFLYWNKPKDDYEIEKYNIYLNKKLFKTVSLNQFKFEEIKNNGNYSIQISAVDFSGKESFLSDEFIYNKQ